MLGIFFVGLVVGLVARSLHPAGRTMTIALALLLGGVGALISFYGGRALRLFVDGQLSGWTAAIVGAAVVVGVGGLLTRARR